MTEKTNAEWLIVIDQIKHIIDMSKKFLSNETIEAVNFYLNHDEYEMAAEGLLIDIMALHSLPENLNIEACHDVARACDLDKSVVWSSIFWTDFIKFYNSHKSGTNTKN